MAGLMLEPLIGAIAAGNVVVLKPSELSPSCSALLVSVINRYLDNKAIKIFQGGVSVNQQLLQHKWDKIFFTGSLVNFKLHYANHYELIILISLVYPYFL